MTRPGSIDIVREVDPAIWVTRAGGAVTSGELVRAGCSRRRIAAAVRGGDLLSLGGGAVGIPGVSVPVIAAVTRRASLACASALAQQGMELLLPPDRVHLTGSRGAPDHRVRWHRGPADGLTLGAARAAAQLLHCRPAVEGLVAVDALLRTERTSAATIAAELPRNRGGHASWVLANASALADSPMESVLRYHLLQTGLTDFVLQARVAGVGRVDFLIQGWLIVEADGWDSHKDRAAFERDRQRDAVAATQGLRTVRFTWDAVLSHIDEVLRCIRRVLAGGPPGLTSAHNQDDVGLEGPM